MVFSVRDIAILTALCAMILTRNDFVTTLVLLVWGAAFTLLSLVFGFEILRRLCTRRGKDRQRPLLPILALPPTWLLFCLAAVIEVAGIPSSWNLALPAITAVSLAMFAGLGASSIPLMLVFEKSRSKLNDETIRTGLWTMVGASLLAGIVFLTLLNQEVLFESPREAVFDLFRVPTAVGLVGASVIAWYLTSTDRELDSYRHQYPDP